MSKKIKYFAFAITICTLTIGFGVNNVLNASNDKDRKEMHDDGELCPDEGRGCIVVTP